MMDTKKLMVGQKVWMRSGDLRKEAVVTEITERYIQAEQSLFNQGERPWMIRFDKNGKQVLWDGAWPLGIKGLNSYIRVQDSWFQDDPRKLCGDGKNPWELIL